MRVSIKVAVIGLVLVGAATLTGCTGGAATALGQGTSAATPSTAAQPVLKAAYPAYGVSFDHVPTWKPFTFEDRSSFSSLITYLSNESLHNPCATSRDQTSVTISCGQPVKKLEPGGVLVRWESFGMPGHRLAAQPGEPRTLGGRPARVQISSADAGCAALSGDSSVSAAIQTDVLSSHDQLLFISACLRNPGVIQAEADVNRMLASVDLTSR